MASSVFFVALAAPEVKMTDLGERYHNPNFVDDIATVADALVLVCAAARRSLRDRISKQSTLSVDMPSPGLCRIWRGGSSVLCVWRYFPHFSD